MAVPSDPFILLSYVNTKLRDFYSDLSDFCKGENEDENDIRKKLSSAGFEYDKNLNKFI